MLWLTDWGHGDDCEFRPEQFFRHFHSDTFEDTVCQLESISQIFLVSDATATASSGPSSLLSTDSTASSSAGGNVHKYSVSSAAASRQMAPKSATAASQPVDESALFQSLEPAECKKVREHIYDVRIF